MAGKCFPKKQSLLPIQNTFGGGVWIQWTGTVEWNGGMDWTGLEWNGMAGGMSTSVVCLTFDL